MNIFETLARIAKYALIPYPSTRYGSVKSSSGGVRSSSERMQNLTD